MLKLYKYEGKNKEEVLKNALNTLGVSEEEVITFEHETEAKLFKAKKIELTVIKKEDVKASIKEFLTELSAKMNMEMHYEIKESENIFNVTLVSDNNSILIGKDGRTMNSVQLVLRQYLNKGLENQLKVNLDVSNYKAKKEKNLEYTIKHLAKEVLSTKVSVKLDPMNSYERRLVHSIVGEFSELETISEGEEPNRYVIIKVKED